MSSHDAIPSRQIRFAPPSGVPVSSFCSRRYANPGSVLGWVTAHRVGCLISRILTRRRVDAKECIHMAGHHVECHHLKKKVESLPLWFRHSFRSPVIHWIKQNFLLMPGCPLHAKASLVPPFFLSRELAVLPSFHRWTFFFINRLHWILPGSCIFENQILLS